MQSTTPTQPSNGQEEEVHLGDQDHGGDHGDDVDDLDLDDEDDLDEIQRNHRYANMPASLLAGLNGIGELIVYDLDLNTYLGG